MNESTVINRVLVVDDERTIRFILRQVLEEQGCEVIDAGSAEEGLSLVDGLEVDVAMLDIVLPGMSGIQLLQAISEVSPQTQVIMMTSHASLETTLEAIKHGAYAYLQKPFEQLDQIWTTVSRAIEKRRLMNLLELRNFELQKASAASRAKTQFLANISHELRTPLHAILGFSELLQQQAGTITPKELNAKLQKISLAGERLLHRITDMVDVSNIESGSFEIIPADFNLRSLVEEIRGRFSEPAMAKGLQLAITLQPDISDEVNGDAERLSQVLTKMLDNAIKFTDSGTIVMNISHSKAGDDSANFRFEIQDTGIGISDETREQIFEPFSQVDRSNSRKYTGSGLGLAIAKHLVEAMGGAIGVRSNNGRGSIFWVTVPLKLQPTATLQPLSSSSNRE